MKLLSLLRPKSRASSSGSLRKPSDSKAEGDVLAALDSLSKQVAVLDNKLDRAWLQIEFLRTRTSAYLGDEIVLTHLVDETPIFINSNDFGGPMNFLDGGRYETENLNVLLSFVTDSTIFIDIGANLGFFTLQIAARNARHGKVYAFEPHPKVYELMGRSVFLNGYSANVVAHNFGLSDQNMPIEFQYPAGHVGGGHVASSGAGGAYTTVRSEVRSFDSVVPEDFICDLVKIDVEGHELQVLRGMHRTLQKSPAVKILLEKLSANAGYEGELMELLASHGLSLYGVSAGARLLELPTLSALQAWGGYILAIRKKELAGILDRERFCIYPRQLSMPNQSHVHPNEDGSVSISGKNILFYGPYWFLPRGVWRLKIHGKLSGQIRIDIAERFGWKVLQIDFDSHTLERDFICERDLVKFECVARADGAEALLHLQRLEFIRIG